MTARDLRRLLAVAALIAGLLVYWDGARRSPLLDSGEQERRSWLIAQTRGDVRDPLEEARLAEAYWSRYPDVAANARFGRHGKLGSAGAREHFRLHGRKEGRVWD